MATHNPSEVLPTTGINRRSVLTAAAWSAPAIAIAVSAPAAAASVDGWDVFIASPNAGDSIPVFSADLTTRYSASWIGVGWIVANHGTLAAPAGTLYSLTYDNRIFDVTGFRGRDMTDPATSVNLTLASKVASGVLTTVTATIPVAIPPGSDSSTGYGMAPVTEIVAKYPNDTLATPPEGSTINAIVGSQDTNPTNNVRVMQGHSNPQAVSPWGVVTTGTTAPFAFFDGSPLPRAVTASVTSIGPQPVPAVTRIRTAVDERSASAIAVSNVKLNGVDAPTALTFDESQSWFGLQLSAYFAINVTLNQGDVLTFNIDYTDVDQTNPLNPSYPRQVGQTGLDTIIQDDSNMRAPELSYFNHNAV